MCTIFFAGLVFHSTIEVFRSSLSVLLEEVPPHIDLSLLEADIQNVSGVSNTHFLHVWSVSHGYFALSVHVIDTLLL
jgi:Co/Zn/Cd efflux system component